jgi:hypothetical protein
MAVTGKVAVTIDLKDQRASDLQSAIAAIATAFEWTVADGNGANQMNLLWQDVRTLADGANEDLDVAAALTNIFGAAVFAKVKFIAIKAAAANTTNLTVSRPAANGLVLLAAANDALAPLKPGGFFAFADPSAAGVAVTGGTGDLINIANGAGAQASYTIVVGGTA